ncbi:MAG: MBL fold metallo-hydrolase [Candidatus Paceibacterota bacterium]
MKRVKILALCVGSLLVVNVVVWGASAKANTSYLQVSFLDVGQGDAILIQSPTGNQVLIDGGRGEIVLQKISSIMPFYDKSIDVVIGTHPDLDHIGGLPYVYDAYEVAYSVDSGAESDTSAFRGYKERRDKEGSVYLSVRRGDVFHLGGGAELVILFPDRDVSQGDANDGSIIAMLTYGETAVMLTGDASKKIERHILSLDGVALESTILKAGHHGSKTSSDELFVATIAPQFAVISASENNSYGHPHPEVMDVLSRHVKTVLSTAESGTVTFVGDGKEFWIK